MKKFKKLFLLILSLSLALTLFSCGGGGDCTEHKDEDANGICDVCKKEITPQQQSSEVVLVENGAALFRIVVGTDVSEYNGIHSLVNKFKTQLRNLGVDVEFVYEGDSDDVPQDCELLIGNVSSRGEEYSIDGHRFGENGYAIQLIGTKVIVSAGSETALAEVLDILASDIFNIESSTTSITSVVMTSEQKIIEQQNDYYINSISVNGNDLDSYVIAVDKTQKDYFKAAQTLQDNLYKQAGYYLNIVSLDSIDMANPGKTVVLVSAPKDNTGADSFTITASGETLTIRCEYSNAVLEKVQDFIARTITLADEGSEIDLEGEVYTADVSKVYYDDFGAKGDGRTNDFMAMYEAHAYANISGQTVYATSGKTYLITDTRDGKDVLTIEIQTNVVWTGATIIIDDEKNDITYVSEDRMSRYSIFAVTSNLPAIQIDGNALAALNLTNIGRETTKLDLGLGYKALLVVYNDDHECYIRYGENYGTGAEQHEIVLIDENGNIDKDTPFLLDYEKVTRIIVRDINVEPITITGGTLVSKANPRNTVGMNTSGTSYVKRNFQISRSNTTLIGVTHKITGELSFYEQMVEGKKGSVYSGFFGISGSYNVLMEDCTLSARRCYGSSSYGLSIGTSTHVTFKNCDQTNFYVPTGDDENAEHIYGRVSAATYKYNGQNIRPYWGLMGSNYCKNVTMDGSSFSRFDAHAGIYNGKVINGSKVSLLNLTGGGEFLIENSTVEPPNNNIINLRQDYGSTWRGTIIIRNSTVELFSGDNEFSICSGTWRNWYFGYDCYLPNLVVDNITLRQYKANANKPLPTVIDLYSNHIFSDAASKNYAHVGLEILADDTKNENIYQAPTYVTLLNNGDYKFAIYDIPLFTDIEINADEGICTKVPFVKYQ